MFYGVQILNMLIHKITEHCGIQKQVNLIDRY